MKELNEVLSGAWQFGESRPHQFLNEIIDSLTGLHKQDDPPWLLQLGHHFLQGVRAKHLGALRLIGQEVINFGDCPIKSTDLERQGA